METVAKLIIERFMETNEDHFVDQAVWDFFCFSMNQTVPEGKTAFEITTRVCTRIHEDFKPTIENFRFNANEIDDLGQAIRNGIERYLSRENDKLAIGTSILGLLATGEIK